MEEMTPQPDPRQPQEPEVQFFEPHRSSTLEGVVNTLEWLLVALILALVFRAFAVEAFQIPTGSMAETLKGSHYHLRCLQCGFSYDVGAESTLYQKPQCPSCGYLQPVSAVGRLQNGDRIFVLKCLYQYVKPRRWDVVVFKNPTDPLVNYIKRLIALPGETVQIIDGDIYINGQIQRKPAKVQDELWMPIYNNDYEPFGSTGLVRKATADEQNPLWKQPFENEPNTSSRWNLNADGSTVFALAVDDARTHSLVYNSSLGNDFHAFYGYNHDFVRPSQPVCSDLMMRFWVRPGKTGSVGVSLEKDQIHYIATVDFAGLMQLSRRQGNQIMELARMPIAPTAGGKSTYFEFANVDRRLVLRYGEFRLSFDLSTKGVTEKEDVRHLPQPEVRILGTGQVRLSHIGLFRDTYYLSRGILRATEEDPFTLEKDEFFVCGDNSPNSLDARHWSVEGKGITNQPTYRVGVVPMDYMMGKAFMVYWSDAFSPLPNMMPCIPNLDRIKIIYGSSDEVY